MNPQPQSKALELFEKLSSFKPGELDDFSLRKFEKEAKSFLQSDPPSAYMIFGALSTFENDVQGMHSNHKNAIKLSGGSTVAHQNYAASLSRMGFFVESFDQFAIAHQREKENLIILFRTINAAARCGRIIEAKSLINEWAKLKPNDSIDTLQLYSNAFDIVKKNKISEKTIVDLICLATSSLHEKGIYPQSNHLSVLDDTLIFNITINSPIEKVEKLEDYFDEKLQKISVPSNILVQFDANDPKFDKFIDYIDEQMNHSDLLVKPDKNLMREIEDLIEGVELD